MHIQTHYSLLNAVRNDCADWEYDRERGGNGTAHTIHSFQMPFTEPIFHCNLMWMSEWVCVANVYYSNKLLYAFADLEMAVKIAYTILHVVFRFAFPWFFGGVMVVVWGGLIFNKTTLYRYSIEKENLVACSFALACSYLDLSVLGPPYTRLCMRLKSRSPHNTATLLKHIRTHYTHISDFAFESIMLHIGTM